MIIPCNCLICGQFNAYVGDKSYYLFKNHIFWDIDILRCNSIDRIDKNPVIFGNYAVCEIPKRWFQNVLNNILQEFVILFLRNR
jgi:hypothetical protein